MNEMQEIISYVGLGALVFVLFTVVLGFLWGMKRGLGKATFRLILLVVCMIGALIIANVASGVVLGTFEGKTVGEAISGFYPDYNTMDPTVQGILDGVEGETAEHLLALPLTLLVTPIVFVLLFYALKIITLLPFWITCGICGFFKKKKTWLSRLGGGAVGAIMGLLICVVAFVPLSGLMGVASDAKTPLTSEKVPEETRNEIVKVYEDVIDPLTSAPAFAITSGIGGKALYFGLTNVSVGGISYNTYDQAGRLVGVAADAMVFMSEDFDWKNPEAYESQINVLVGDIGNNEYLSSVVSGALRAVANAADSGAVQLPEEEPFGDIIKDVVAMLKTSSKDNLNDDLSTLASVYTLLGKYDVFDKMEDENSDALLEALISKPEGQDKSIITLVTEELNKNPRTATLTAALAKLSVYIIGSQSGIEGENAEELYEDVKGSLNDVLTIDKSQYATEEEYTAAVSDKLDEEFRSHDIAIDKEILDGMAEYINENLSDLENITDAEINQAILSYYEALADYMDSQNPDDGGSNPDEGGSNPDEGGSNPDVEIPDGETPIIPID